MFTNNVLEMEYVGSRVTCNPAPTDTDEDILVLVESASRFVATCKDNGYEGGEVYFNKEGSTTSEFYSLRKEDTNLIVTEKKDFFEKFMLASHVCKSLNVLLKKDRITVFQAILYSKKAGSKP